MSEGRELLTFSRDRAKEANAIYYAIGNFDVEFKAVGYLLAANAAGLAGCVTLLKDYATVPQLKGIGVFICLFSLGFIFAVIGFVAITIHRQAWLGAFAPNALSCLLLCAAVALMIGKFIWL